VEELRSPAVSGDSGPAIRGSYHLSAEGSKQQLLGDLDLQGRFPIGSVTKTLTALLAARLACDGVIGWDDPLGSSDGGRRPVSLRTLLTHTAAVSFELESNHWFGPSLTDDELARALSHPPRMPLPPNTWHYSNLGYAMAARLLERATGESFESLLAQFLFQPLGMAHTSMPDAESEGSCVLGAAAPAGDIWSTPEDLMALGRALDRGNPGVVTHDMLALLLESGTPDGDGSYLCAGVRTHAVGRFHRVLVSSGTILGRTTCLTVWPQRGYSLVVAEAGYPHDSLRDLAIAKWTRNDTVACTWWWDGQEVAELRHGNDVELRLRETTWPFAIFSGRRAGRTLVGVGSRGEPLTLKRSRSSVRGPSLTLTRSPSESAFIPMATEE
jgi:CubicO group peptidase (beta-lactamase class C family)